MILVLTLFTIICTLILAVLVIARHKTHPAHQAMFCLFLCLASWAVSNWLSLQSFPVEVRFFWVRCVMFVTAPIPFLFLLFTLHFPINQRLTSTSQIRRRVLQFSPWLTVWTTAVMFASFTPLMFSGYSLDENRPRLEVGAATIAYGSSFLVFTVLAVMMLVSNYRQQHGLPRLQTGYVLFGLSLTILVGFIANFVLVTFWQNFDLVAIGPLSSLFLVVCVSYSMLKHRLLDLRLAVVRLVAYILTLVVIVVLYSIVLSLCSMQLGKYFPYSNIYLTTAIGIIFSAFCFPVVLKITHRVTQKLFYQSVFQSTDAYFSLAQIIASQVTSELLLKDLVNFFDRHFQVIWSRVLMKPNPLVTSFLDNMNQTGQQLSHLDVLVTDELAESPLKLLLRKENIAVLLPLMLQSELLGVVCLGAKRSGDAFTVEEIRFLQSITAQLTLAINHVGSMEQMKDDFVSIASHELRTPMTAIRSYLWLCLFKPDVKLPLLIKQHLQTAYQATERMLELVHDLLTVSQLDIHHSAIRKDDVDLGQLTQSIIHELDVQAKAKRVQIVYSVTVQSSRCSVDQLKMNEIIYNLLSNAIKFSPPQQAVTVTISGDDQCLQLTVADHGEGIALADQQRLFQKFGVIQNSYRKVAAQGTGLGLYIAQQYAQLHGGQISVKSDPGVGATFMLAFPRNYQTVNNAWLETYDKKKLTPAY